MSTKSSKDHHLYKVWVLTVLMFIRGFVASLLRCFARWNERGWSHLFEY